MRAALWLAGWFWATAAVAQAPALEELRLLSEHRVEGMAAGNLSGLARCGEALMALSDREDDRLYRLQISPDGIWQAAAEPFAAPSMPPSGLPWGLRARSWMAGVVRGGELDFEGLACDAQGNRYLLSEAVIGVLRLTPEGQADWLPLPSGLLRQARASGMLLRANALLEGIAIDPTGETLWLAAERERRGLLVLHRGQSAWRCTGGCILHVEGGRRASLVTPGSTTYPRDFSDLSWHAGKLFSLERLEHRICRRAARTGDIERCWSFGEVALAPERRYRSPFGTAEGLALDGQGAWLGHDNGGAPRADGELRPVIWRLAAPAGGWLAR